MLKKRWSPEKVDELYDRGVLTEWITRKKEKARVVPYDSQTGWKRWVSIRTGAIGVKIGMTQEVDMWGGVHPVTVIQIRENHVLQVKTEETEPEKKGYCKIQVGAGLKRLKRVTKSMKGHFAKAGVPPKEKIVEFKVSKDAILPVGTRIHATHFVVGQYVDVYSTSKGKGFQGVMKKYGFGGQPASHGVSVTHRHGGSIGQRQDPGKVWPGKKMPGRMGGKRGRNLNLQIMKINAEDEILFVRGTIHGPKGCWVEVRDAHQKPHRLPPPYPTRIVDVNKKPRRKYLRLRFFDPYYKERHTDWATKWEEARKALKSQGTDEDDEE